MNSLKSERDYEPALFLILMNLWKSLELQPMIYDEESVQVGKPVDGALLMQLRAESTDPGGRDNTPQRLWKAGV